MKRTDLSPAITELIRNENFYAELILQMRRIETDSIPTAGVSVKDGEVTLYLNPDFWAKLSTPVQAGILKHECLHVLSAHFDRRGILDPKLWNFATDAAINEFIPILQDPIKVGDREIEGVTVLNLRKRPKLKDLERFQSSEYYYEALSEAGEAGDAGDALDDHSVWQEGDAEVSRAAVAELVKAAEARAGSLPKEVESLVSKLLASKVSWKQILQRFVDSATEFVSEPSRKRRNRRFGLVQPGTKRDPRLHLGLAVDTSGSMSDEALQQVFSEVDKISEYARVTVIVADAEVHEVFEYQRGQKIQLKGRGGTAYQPAFEKAAELAVDALIYFGDMDCADEPRKPAFPVLWAIVGQQAPPASFGRKVRIE